MSVSIKKVKRSVANCGPRIKNSLVVQTEEDLQRVRDFLSTTDEFAYDTETNTLRVYGRNKDAKLVGISISKGEDTNFYIPVGHIRDEDINKQLPLGTVIDYLKEPFEREDVRIIGQNLKFDMHTLLNSMGIHIRTKDLFDTMIASWLCDENTPNGLKENSEKLLGISQTHFKEAIETVPNDVKKKFGLKANSKATFDLVRIDDGAPYALDDAFYTYEIYKVLKDKLKEEEMDKIYNKVYVPFIRTIFDMERRGVTVDLNRLEEMNKEIKRDMDELFVKIIEKAGVEFNPSSSTQLALLLFGYSAPQKPQELSKLPKYVQNHYNNGDFEAMRKAGYEVSEKGEIFKLKPENDKILKNCFRFKVTATTKKGAPQTNSDTLWKISNLKFTNKRKQEGTQMCRLLLEYKKLDKLHSAFIVGLKEQLYDDGKAHPSFNIIGTDSGRLSCSSPNLQQLPKAGDEDKYQIRSLFIGSEYLYYKEDTLYKGRKYIVALDFANLEMRILAHFSEDKNLLNMFKSGADTHGDTAVNMFNLDCSPDEVKKKYPHLRQAAKVLNFLLMYGGGASTLYENLASDWYNPVDLGDEQYLKQYNVKRGVDVAQIYIDKYFSTYSGVSKFIRNQKKFAHRHGYVQTLLRRKRRLPDINSHDMKMQSYCERLSVNSAVQGSAADLTMSAQNRISADPWFEENGVFMLLQVHDELVFECPRHLVDETIKRVKRYMEHAFGDNVELNLPMRADADFGKSYQEAK